VDASRCASAIFASTFVQKLPEAVTARAGEAQSGKHMAVIVGYFPDFMNKPRHRGS
jgi:hypothetical protein